MLQMWSFNGNKLIRQVKWRSRQLQRPQLRRSCSCVWDLETRNTKRQIRVCVNILNLKNCENSLSKRQLLALVRERWVETSTDLRVQNDVWTNLRALALYLHVTCIWHATHYPHIYLIYTKYMFILC